jgi:hypothetical protein
MAAQALKTKILPVGEWTPDNPDLGSGCRHGPERHSVERRLQVVPVDVGAVERAERSLPRR